jgi:curved DNA-binding protein CbpA
MVLALVVRCRIASVRRENCDRREDQLLKDHYAALGVAADADHEVIRAAFRALAKKYHPDTTADPAVAKARFREINEAHSVLSNPKARAEYDRLLSAGRNDSSPSKSRESARPAPEGSSEATVREGPSLLDRAQYWAAALFVFGFGPAVLLLVGVVIVLAIVEIALGI